MYLATLSLKHYVPMQLNCNYKYVLQQMSSLAGLCFDYLVDGGCPKHPLSQQKLRLKKHCGLDSLIIKRLLFEAFKFVQCCEFNFAYGTEHCM